MKVLLQLLMIYFLPHQLLLSVIKEKTEPYLVVVIFLWKMFGPFQTNVPIMKKPVFP